MISQVSLEAPLMQKWAWLITLGQILNVKAHKLQLLQV